jgi:hypothetical protein
MRTNLAGSFMGRSDRADQELLASYDPRSGLYTAPHVLGACSDSDVRSRTRDKSYQGLRY